MLRYIAAHLQPGQARDNWEQAGIAILTDGSAVLQNEESYTVRYRRGRRIRETALPSDMAWEERHLPTLGTGPLYQSPDIDEKIAGRAKDLQAEEDEEFDDDDEPTDTGLTTQDAYEACPELADAIAETLLENGDIPDTARERIRLDVIDLASLTLERLDEEAMNRLVRRAAQSMYHSGTNDDG